MRHFYIKQRIFSIGDKYNIYDENENLCYKATGEIFTLTSKLHVFDEKKQKEIFFIRKKFFTFLPQYEMYKDENLVASVIKRFTFFSHKIDITSDFGDFEVLGDFMSHDFEINYNSKVVASVHKRWLSFGDTYEITINDDSKVDFFIALVIMIDNCIHNESSHNNHNNNN